MKPSRFLEWTHWIVPAASVPLFAIWAVLAWQGEKLPIVMLATFASIWVVMAEYAGYRWRRTIRNWEHVIDDFSEVSELNADTASLLSEALSELAIYDGEKAHEIADRANTIAALRLSAMNRKERE
jgi:hypothetical protein